MPNEPLSAAEVLALLADNPTQIARVTGSLTPAQLQARPGPDEWSANDVLAHLRCCADVWGAGLRTILDNDQPTIRAVSPRGWIKRTSYLDLDFASSMDAFVTQRNELLALLRPLSRTDWTRTATVKASGKASTWTVCAYAGRLANHEHHHLAQLERIAGRFRS